MIKKNILLFNKNWIINNFEKNPIKGGNPPIDITFNIIINFKCLFKIFNENNWFK